METYHLDLIRELCIPVVEVEMGVGVTTEVRVCAGTAISSTHLTLLSRTPPAGRPRLLKRTRFRDLAPSPLTDFNIERFGLVVGAGGA